MLSPVNRCKISSTFARHCACTHCDQVFGNEKAFCLNTTTGFASAAFSKASAREHSPTEQYL